MGRLTLQPRTWYALDYLTAAGSRHASPIWVTEVVPAKTGNGELLLHFHHANYPEGVQDKAYRLRVLRRTPAFIVAERVDAPAPCPLVLLTEVTAAWIQLHWPQYRVQAGDLQAWCDEAIGRPGHPPRVH